MNLKITSYLLVHPTQTIMFGSLPKAFCIKQGPSRPSARLYLPDVYPPPFFCQSFFMFFWQPATQLPKKTRTCTTGFLCIT